MADEGLHEIQLNGKQLVFLFMASTVVAVVIFLCGVMVGRGVRVQRPADAIEASVDAASDPTVVTQAPLPAASTAAAPTNAPVASQETLTYPDRLEGHEPAEETLKPGLVTRDSGVAASSAKPVATTAKPEPALTRLDLKAIPTAKVEKPAAVTNAAPAAKIAPASAAAAPPALSREPAGTGFVVQVAAVNDRREADTIAKRLAGKGYPSFVTTPPNGTPRTFRVRIGKYANRRDAESIAARLQKEEQFKPWITK
jgi:cell division septation protein DedD